MNDNEANSLTEHVPVLTKELTEQIVIPQDAVVVDATLGHGGHSLLFGKNLGPEGIIIGLDYDGNCLRRAHKKLADLECKKILEQVNFARIDGVIAGHGIEKVDLIFADLGFCSGQLEDSERGFSFQQEQPLDMRLDSSAEITAADIVNEYDERRLADLIYSLGAERRARRIARLIVEQRTRQKITTTVQLARIVARALNTPLKGRRSRTHPATKTFQALRIAVNDEIGNLEKLLGAGPELLQSNGFFAVISFHSLEDRLVKNDFRENSIKGAYELVTKKPVRPSRSEIEQNPRARSAKLRIARRL